jgi:simple sugar transport system ATP-binding protein
MVDRGELSVLLITHKFRDVMRYADRVTVLRKGRVVGTRTVARTSQGELAEMMMGDRRAVDALDRAPKTEGEVALSVANLRVRGDKGLDVLHDLSFEARSGEILGIAGISGNGQREFVEVVAGQRLCQSGSITVNGEPYSVSRECMRRLGVFVLPEMPLRNASVPSMTVAENIALREFDQPPISRHGLLSYDAVRKLGAEWIEKFSVSPPSPDLPISTLSGGNVQRAILARELGGPQIRVLIAANPCFGLDFAATRFIHNRLIEARNRGASVVLISEDLDELMDLADRILVMNAGRIVYRCTRSEAGQVEIGRHMAAT